MSILAVSAIYEAPAASAYHNQALEVWSATLTVGDTSGFGASLGCETGVVGTSCASASVLTDDDFTSGNVVYDVIRVERFTQSGGLVLILNKAIPAGLTLYVGNVQFSIADASLSSNSGIANSRAFWSNTGLSWSVGDTVQLRLTGEPTLWPCEVSSADYRIVLEGTGDVADGTLCSNDDDYYLDVSLRDRNGNPVNPTKDVCVLVERLSGDKIIASEIGLPRENYIRANTPSVTFRMNADTDLQVRTLDGKPVTIVARTGGLSDTFDLTVVHDTGSESCPAPSTNTRSTPGTGGTTPGTGGGGGGGGTSTPTTPSSGGAFFFVPSPGDTTSPTIISMNTTGNATRTLGDGAPLLFNITFSETVSGVDPADFVLSYGNDTLPVSANATRIIASTSPEQVVPHDDTGEFVIEMESGATTHDGATINNGTVRFDIEHLGSHLLEVSLTAPDCRTILVHNQTFLFRSELAEPRTIEPLAGSPVAGPWTLAVRNLAMYHNATVHQYGLALDVGPAITVNGTGSNYLVAVNAAAAGNLTLGLADGHDIADASGNRLAGGIPAGANNTYVLAEPPRRTCP